MALLLLKCKFSSFLNLNIKLLKTLRLSSNLELIDWKVVKNYRINCGMNFNYFTCFGIFFIVYYFVAILVVHTNGQEGCLCNAKFVGEYCGSELGANCSRELIYFCGKSNLKRQAFPLRACTEKGYECSTKEQKGKNQVRKGE